MKEENTGLLKQQMSHSRVFQMKCTFHFTYIVTLLAFGAIISMIAPKAVLAEPIISSVSPSLILNEGQGGVVIDGTGFTSNPVVYITKNNDWNDPGQIVEQSLSMQSDTQITFTVTTCGITYHPLMVTQAGDAWLWVVDDTGTTTATGLLVHLDSVKDNNPPIVSDWNEEPSPALHPPGYSSVSRPDEVFPVFLPPLFEIRGKFYESPENGPVLCQYSIDDGQSWINLPSENPSTGVLYGLLYCTATPIPIAAPEGPVAIKMRAYSTCGGWGETITKNRIIDGSGPDSGASFSVTAGNQECSLSWDETTDSGVGMHETEPYEVRYGKGGAPSGCSYGTSLYNGLYPQSPVVHSGLDTGYNYYYILCYQDTFGNKSMFSGGPVECVNPGIILSPGALTTINWVGASSADFGVNSFRLKTNAPPAIVTELQLYGTTISSVDTVKIFKDDGTVPNSFDAGDTFITSGSFTGTDLTLSGLNIPVTDIAEQYIATVNTIASPLQGEIITFRVLSAIGDLPVTGADGGGAYITVDSNTPTTTDNVPAEWQNSEITITLTPNDNGGVGVDQATGIYGCLGTGCTPVLLGGNTMTTSCGADNECSYDVRYYSVDILGQAEPVKTAVNQVMVDRKPPTAGTFTVQGGLNPMPLSWSGFSDLGSHLWGSDRYTISRLLGSTPPPDCTSNKIYMGIGESYSDGNVVDGQQYAYTLCVKDGAGNITTLTATATAQTCITETQCGSCHSLPAAGAHQYHPMPCFICHEGQLTDGMPNDPSHTDGMIRLIDGKTAYAGGDLIPYPGSGMPPLTCGGSSGPIGGTLNSQPPQNPAAAFLACHWGANWGGQTPINIPDITPYWECVWDSTRDCNYVGIDAPSPDDCNACHGIPVGTGVNGADYFAGGHQSHVGIECIACHQETGPDPAHLNGMVPVLPGTGWNGANPQSWPGVEPWPDAIPPTTCGGGLNPVGGDANGGPMGCHTGTPVFSVIQPSWECIWDDEINYCIDPTQMGP